MGHWHDAHWATASVLVSERLTALFSRGIVKMNHQEGFQANLTTAMLVGLGANLGLPMSTTHVATGAIAGLAHGDVARLNRRTLRDFSLAWTVTPFSAGLVSAIVFRMLS